jgi:hypothetical protein
MVLPVLNKDTPNASIIKEDSVNVTLISTSGNSIVYQLAYSFNPKLSNSLNAKTLIIGIGTKTGNNSKIPQLIKGFTTEEITENILQQVNIYKNISLAKNSYPFSITRNLSKYYDPKTIEKQRLYTTVYINSNVGQLNTLNQNNSSYNQNINANVNTNTFATTKPFNLRQIREGLKQTQKIDPASLYTNPTNAIIPTSKAIAGLIPKRNLTQTSLYNINPKVRNLLSSYLSKNIVNLRQNLAPQSYITEIKKVTVDLLNISDRLIIPIQYIGQNDFKLIFDLYDDYGNRVQNFETFIPHNTNINNLIITKPPFAVETSSTGLDNIKFSIEQIDRYATGVAIFRKVVYKQQNTSNANYLKVADVELKPGDPPYLFSDKVLSTSDMIYRFVPYDRNKRLASVFSTNYVRHNSINKTGTNVPVPKKISSRQSYCTLDYSIDNDCIIVRASNFPAQAVAICFYKKNRTINESRFIRIGNPIRIQANSLIPSRVIDAKVKKYNIYEYKVGIIYPDGIEELTPSVLAIEFRPIEDNIAVSTITNVANTSYIDGTPDVTFTVNYSYNKNQYEDIKQLLIDQNLISEYSDAVSANRELLGRLLAFQVLRLNMSTGELEDFGVITNPDFSDRKQGLAKGVKPLVSGVEYSYKITTLLRDPQTMFPTITRTVSKSKKTSQNQISKSYTLYPYEWLQPVTMRYGTLYNDTSVTRTYPNTLPSFEFGKVVDRKEVNVNILSNLPNVSNAKALVYDINRCLLTWEISGDVSKVDHFMIIRDMLGMKTIVGAAHSIPLGNDNKYKFLDTFTNNEKGQAIYNIIPIYYDDTEGQTAQTNTILI